MQHIEVRMRKKKEITNKHVENTEWKKKHYQ